MRVHYGQGWYFGTASRVACKAAMGRLEVTDRPDEVTCLACLATPTVKKVAAAWAKAGA